MKLIIPIILALLGTGAGVGAAIVMGADKQSHETEIACMPAAEKTVAETPPSSEEAPPSDGEFVKLANQFLVPVLVQDEVDAMVVMSLSLEVEPGTTSEVFHLEPKIRDKFLQILFDHANKGHFGSGYTSNRSLEILRNALRAAAQDITRGKTRDVLIVEIAKQ